MGMKKNTISLQDYQDKLDKMKWKKTVIIASFNKEMINSLSEWIKTNNNNRNENCTSSQKPFNWSSC